MNQIPWYVARSSGLVAWALIVATIVWGLLLATKVLGRRPTPAWLLSLHRYLGALTVAFVGVHVVAILVDSSTSFGLVNVLAVIPLTPGGLGVIDVALPSALVGFGLTRSTAVLGVATYRLAQFFFPIVLGGVLYASLRVGPWSIERRERLKRLRDLAADEASNPERAFDFAVRFGHRPGRPMLPQGGTDPYGEPGDPDR